MCSKKERDDKKSVFVRIPRPARQGGYGIRGLPNPLSKASLRRGEASQRSVIFLLPKGYGYLQLRGGAWPEDGTMGRSVAHGSQDQRLATETFLTSIGKACCSMDKLASSLWLARTPRLNHAAPVPLIVGLRMKDPSRRAAAGVRYF